MSERESNDLSNREELIVAMAVLLDGYDAEKYLSIYLDKGELMSKLAKELNVKSPQEKLPYVAAMLRRAKQGLIRDNS